MNCFCCGPSWARLRESCKPSGRRLVSTARQCVAARRNERERKVLLSWPQLASRTGLGLLVLRASRSGDRRRERSLSRASRLGHFSWNRSLNHWPLLGHTCQHVTFEGKPSIVCRHTPQAQMAINYAVQWSHKGRRPCPDCPWLPFSRALNNLADKAGWLTGRRHQGQHRSLEGQQVNKTQNKGDRRRHECRYRGERHR